MIRQMLVSMSVAVSMLVGSNTTAQAQLAPQRPDDLVTLTPSGDRCTGGAFKMNTRVFPDGSSFSPWDIPGGKLLVITDFQWGPSSVGANKYELATLFLDNPAFGTATVGIGGNNSPGASGGNGLVGSSSSIQNWVAVSPGVPICVGGFATNPFAIVHGFLANP